MNLQSHDDESRIPFGALIEKIASLEAAYASTNENATEDRNRLRIELRNAYEELQQKAERKVNDWKKGPIVKEKHVTISDLKL